MNRFFFFLKAKQNTSEMGENVGQESYHKNISYFKRIVKQVKSNMF